MTGTKKLSCKKARGYVKEEKASSKEYKKYGFTKLAKQEGQHSKVFKKYVNKNCPNKNKKKKKT